MRKSLMISRSSSRKSMRAQGLINKQASLRGSLNLKSFTLGSEKKKTSLQEVTEVEIKNARIENYSFLDPVTPPEKTEMRTQVELRVQEPSKKAGLRASLLKPKKVSGEIEIGDGKIIIRQGFTNAKQFEIGFVEFLTYSSLESLEIVLKFFKDERVFFVTFESATIAKSFVKEMIVQARQQCYALNKVLESMLPEDWATLLSNTGKSVESITILDETQSSEIDIIFRELIDLSKFARGPEDLDFVDLCGRFSKWLLNNKRMTEYGAWEDIAIKGRAIHAEKSAQNISGGRFLGKKLDERSDGVDAIRNPVDLSEVADLKVRSIPTNLDTRIKLINEGLKKVNETFKSQDSGDRFETLI